MSMPNLLWITRKWSGGTLRTATLDTVFSGCWLIFLNNNKKASEKKGSYFKMQSTCTEAKQHVVVCYLACSITFFAYLPLFEIKSSGRTKLKCQDSFKSRIKQQGHRGHIVSTGWQTIFSDKLIFDMVRNTWVLPNLWITSWRNRLVPVTVSCPACATSDDWDSCLVRRPGTGHFNWTRYDTPLLGFIG